MTVYAIYYTATGEINQIYHGNDPSIYIDPGEASILIDDSISDKTHYVPGGVLTVRPLITSICSWDTLSLSADGTTIVTFGSSLPTGTEYSVITPVGVTNLNGTISDGIFSLKTKVVGVYTIFLKIFPYQEYTEYVTAVAVNYTGLDTLKIQTIYPTAYSYDRTSFYIAPKYITQIAYDVQDEIILDTLNNVSLLQINQIPIDISQQMGYSYIFERKTILQYTSDIPVTSYSNLNQSLELFTIIQSYPISEISTNYSQIFIDKILQEATEIASDKNYSQLLYVKGFTQSALDII